MEPSAPEGPLEASAQSERVPGRGKLSLVATPIGNLEDITLRALRILGSADAVLAEDTRRTRGLLTHHGLSTRLESVHEHTSPEKIEVLTKLLEGGAHYALVTDAGSPLVSDPGAALLSACVARGVAVEAIPGPSAPIAALSVAGFSVPSFEFLGFLPRSGSKRTQALSRLSQQPGAIVLFESPNRVGDTLADLAAALGPTRKAALCRELTKLHEEVARGTLAELAARFSEGTLGEVTLVIAPDEHAGEPLPLDEADLDACIDRGLLANESARDLAKALSEQLKIPKRDVYERILLRRGPKGSPPTEG